MRKTVFAFCCMAASVAWAQESEDTDREEMDSVDLRVSVIENIDVTAEKTPVVSADETGPEIDAILEAAEAAEEDDSEE
ncbi:MAG: hypothetical protein OEM63_13870 [Gammaproteobacteria bacterium]|nr:hypothetical protein [Gammaproteobacteria bacterium]